MPRKITGAAFVSLDGVMQAPGGPEEDPTGGFAYGGWLEPVADEGLGNQIDAIFAAPFDLLLGRRTYDIFAAYWPFMTQEHPISAKFAVAGKHVLSRSDIALEWQGSHRLPDIDAVAALKAGDGPDLVIQGSASLYPQLLGRGLIDRLIVMTAPVMVGGGKRLFGDGTPPGNFRVIEHRTTSGGLSLTTYEPAGDLQTGSFPSPDPSPAELARREKLKAEG